MQKCLIVGSEITQDECDLVVAESCKEKNGKDLPKKYKRIIGWKYICKSCKNHIEASDK